MKTIKGLSIIHRLIVYILKKLDRDVGIVELVKMVYLIDVEYFKLFGETLTGLGYIRQKLGPYTRDISNAVTDLEEKEPGVLEVKIISSRGHSPILKRSHKIKEEVQFDPDLKSEEKEVANQVLDNIKFLTPKQLENESYKTEPMKEILKKETKVKEKLYGASLDFSLIERNKFMEEWIANCKKTEEDPDYNRHLIKEKEEFLEGMAKL